MLLFPGIIGVLARNHGLLAAHSTYDSRFARFKETLHPDRVDDIAGKRVDKAEASSTRASTWAPRGA